MAGDWWVLPLSASGTSGLRISIMRGFNGFEATLYGEHGDSFAWSDSLSSDPPVAQDEARRWAGRLLAEALERVGVDP